MKNNIESISSSNQIEKDSPFPAKVKTPKTIYFIAAFIFFIMGGYIRVIQHDLMTEFGPQSLAEDIVLLMTLFSMALAIAIAFFNRTALIIGAIMTGLISLLLIAGLVFALYLGTATIPMFIGSFIMIALFGYCAWYCGRKTTLDLAKNHAAYKKHNALMKHIQKNLSQR